MEAMQLIKQYEKIYSVCFDRDIEQTKKWFNHRINWDGQRMYTGRKEKSSVKSPITLAILIVNHKDKTIIIAINTSIE